MSRARNVIEFYVLTNKLKNVIRTGWLNWHVSNTRVESVAEHVYGTLMLALAIYSEYEVDVDIKKVLYMLSIHELEETIIGDLTYLDISSEDKVKIGHKAVEKILSGLIKGEELKKIIFEFDERKTEEAKFAYYCDKLECDLQCKLYDERKCVDVFNQDNINEHELDIIKKIQNGEDSWSSCWMNNDKKRIKFNDIFLEVLDYAIDNRIDSKNEKID